MNRPRNAAAQTRTALRTIAYGVTAAVSPHGRRGHRRSLVLAPAGPGSEGDALLLAGMSAVIGSPSWIANAPGDGPWPGLETGSRALLAAAARMPGGLGRGCAWAAGRPWNGAWFVGADVFDGAYGGKPIAVLDRLDGLGRAGVPTGVCGFSWRPEPQPVVVERVRSAVPDMLFVARGEHSAERFRAATDRPCHVAPDLGWAALGAEFAAGVVPRPTADGTRAPRIGVNVSTGVTRLPRPEGCDSLVDVVARVVDRRRAAGFAVSLIPHDHRPPMVSDVTQLTPLAQQLGLPATEVTMVRGTALRRRIAACDVVVTGRMHLGISALAFGVPVVALPYLDKFEDLAADPMLAPWLRLVDPTAADLEARIDAAVDELLALGRRPEAELEALHARQQTRLATVSRLLADRIGSR